MAFKLSEAVIPVTDLKTRPREILEKVKTTGKPVLITQRGRGAAVLESLEDYERKQEYYEAIEGVLKALRQAEEGNLRDHREALKILESF